MSAQGPLGMMDRMGGMQVHRSQFLHQHGEYIRDFKVCDVYTALRLATKLSIEISVCICYPD